mgnify:CR=1 FL=1
MSSTYKLNGKYSQLKLTMSIANRSSGNASGTIIIKADDNVSEIKLSTISLEK